MSRIAIHPVNLFIAALAFCAACDFSNSRHLIADAPGEPSKKVQDFASAIEKGKAAVDEYQKLSFRVSVLKFQLKSAERDSERVAAEAELETVVPGQQEHLKTALAAYENAIRLATNEEGDIREGFDEQETDVARLVICTLYYQSNNYMRAAQLGEWIARNRPMARVAANAARLAVGAYVRQHRESRLDAAPPEKLFEFATYLWKERQDEEAVMAAIAEVIELDPALARQFTPRATELLRDVVRTTQDKPLDDRFRIGEALQIVWQVALLVGEPNDAPAAGSQCPESEALLAELKGHADDLLTSAHEELAKNMSNVFRRRFLKPAHVSGVLALVRLRTMNGQFDEAQKILEHRVYGPLSLLRDNHKSIIDDYPSTLEQAILWPATLLYWSMREEEKLKDAMTRMEHANVIPLKLSTEK